MNRVRSVKFSIIMASYNRAKVIEQAISSVVNQNYDNFEFIVVDGGSTDGTIDILKKYGTKIKWISEPDGGIYDAWNKGVKMATGDYILFIGSDDSMVNYGVLRTAASYLDGHNEIDFLVGGVLLLDEKYKIEHYLKDNMNYVDEGEPVFLPTEGVFIKLSVAKSILFDTSFRVFADTFFFRKAFYSRKYRFVSVFFPVTFFADSGISNTMISEERKIEHYRCLDAFGLKDKVTARSFKISLKILGYKMLELLRMKDIVLLLIFPNMFRRHHCTNKICRWCGRYETDSI